MQDQFVTVHVRTSGTYNHSEGDYVRRPVKGKQREEMGEALEHQSATEFSRMQFSTLMEENPDGNLYSLFLFHS